MIKELWFATPIWYADLVYDFSVQEKELLLLRESDPGVNFTNRNGYQSNDLSTSTNHEIQHLLRCITYEASKVFGSINTSKTLALNLENAWANLNDPGAYNVTHSHPGAALSAVLYLSAPENAGNIVFHRNDRLKDYIFTDALLDFPLSIIYTPRKNMLLVFPGWLDHTVEQNKSNETRISVAANFTLKECN